MRVGLRCSADKRPKGRGLTVESITFHKNQIGLLSGTEKPFIELRRLVNHDDIKIENSLKPYLQVHGIVRRRRKNDCSSVLKDAALLDIIRRAVNRRRFYFGYAAVIFRKQFI